MDPPRVHFSVRRLMVAVAVFAVLIPFPIEAIFRVVIAVSVFWLPVLLFSLGIDVLAGRYSGRFAVVALTCAVGVGVWLLAPHEGWGAAVAGAAGSGLTVANLAGPIYTARRFRRGETLTGGHLLWAWAGLIWPMPFFLFDPHDHGGNLQRMVEDSRLTVAFAVLLALYGARLADKAATWAHHTAWVVLECDMIAWGWYAAHFLRWR